ncbi:hypothetical protein jhhlp_002633 [Lomentospora prolificans]|uniref:Protein SDS23 n=1 Tax=Lomentospora prolificans TaxID=41688 RepID=A0A2N3NEH5_9PEZI|nr:hypothetical protein jhhlp_002633 [Lomentospora prolificans]
MEPLPTSGAEQRARREPSTSSLASVASSHASAVISTLTHAFFADNLRNVPPSPRTQRHPSFTGIPPVAIQDLLSMPPSHKTADPRFAGRDWRDILVGELVSPSDVKWVTVDTSVEDATMSLVKDNAENVVLVRGAETDLPETSITTFDFNDLNTYLLVVVGLAKPEEENIPVYDRIASMARERAVIPLRDIQPICRKQSLVTLASIDKLGRAIEILGSGVHRVLVSDSSGNIVGILSQLKLIEFFWSEGLHFPTIEKLYTTNIRDLGIASKQVLAVNSDNVLADALALMYNEGLTSVAVVDNGYNVVGNISTVDVRLLTSAASAHLLQSSCMHFISVILNERGVEKGRDAFPVFHVNPYSSLAHTVAKLVATRSHRIRDPAPAVIVPSPGSAPQSPAPGSNFGSIPASALPGAHLSGRLSGVVSLTDILNLFAKSTGLKPSDPSEQRARRRRSSSSSVRPSIDSSRPSIDLRR